MFYVAGQPVKLFSEAVTVQDKIALIPITNKSILEFPEPKDPEPPARSPGGTMIVDHGDTLSGIISKAYGMYDKRLLKSVLEKNPHIADPDLITMGQVIQLPEAK